MERAANDAALAVEGATTVVGGLITAVFNTIALLIAFIFPLLIGLCILIPLLVVEEEYPTVINDIVNPTNKLENGIGWFLLIGYDTVALIINVLERLANLAITVWDLFVPVLYWIANLLLAVVQAIIEELYGTPDLQCILAETAWMFVSVLDNVGSGMRDVWYSVKRTIIFDRALIVNVTTAADTVRKGSVHGRKITPLGYDSTLDKFRISEADQERIQYRDVGALDGQYVFDVVNTDNTQAQQNDYVCTHCRAEVDQSQDAPCCQPLGSDTPCNDQDEDTAPTCPSDSAIINVVTPIVDILIAVWFQFVSFVVPFVILFFQTLLSEILVIAPAMIDTLRQVVQLFISSGLIPLTIQFLYGVLVNATGLLRILCVVGQIVFAFMSAVAKTLISIIDSIVVNIVRTFDTWTVPYTCNIIAQSDLDSIEQFLATPGFGRRVVHGRKLEFSPAVYVDNYARGSEHLYEAMSKASSNSISVLSKTEADAAGFNAIGDSIRDPVSPVQHRRRAGNIVQRNFGTGFTSYSSYNEYALARQKLMHRLDYEFLKATTLHLSSVTHWLTLAVTGSHAIVGNSDFMHTIVSRRPAFFQEQTKATVSHLAFHLGVINFDALIGGRSTFDGSFEIRKHAKKQLIPVAPEDYFDLIDYQCDASSFDDGHIFDTDGDVYSSVIYKGSQGDSGNQCADKEVGKDCTADDQCDCFGIWTYNDPSAVTPGPNCSCQSTPDCGLFDSCADQCLGSTNGEAGPSRTFSCNYFSHVCINIMRYSQAYNRSSPEFNQAVCNASNCAKACGLCNTLVCNTTNCSLCYSTSPCLSNIQTANANKDYLGSEESPDGLRPKNCTATNATYEQVKGDPCYSCLGNTIPGYTTNQGCTTCGGVQQKAGDPTAWSARPLGAFGPCSCTSASSEPGSDQTTYDVNCDPQLDPTCTTNMDNSDPSAYSDTIPTNYTTTKPVSGRSVISCLVVDLKVMIEDVLSQFEIILEGFVALLSILPALIQTFFHAIAELTQAAAVWVIELLDGTIKIIRFMYNTHAFARAFQQDLDLYKNSSASYQAFLKSFGDQQDVLTSVTLAHPSSNPSRLGQMNYAILSCDPTFTYDNENVSFRTCPEYSCCSSDPSAADFCRPPIRAIQEFEVANFTQDLISEFYCNYTQLDEAHRNSLEEEVASESKRHVNIEQIQYIKRKNPLLAFFKPMSKKQLERIRALVYNADFDQLWNIAHSESMQSYYVAIDTIRAFLRDSPVPEVDMMNPADPDAFAAWTFESINPQVNSGSMIGRMTRGFKKLFVDYTYVMEELLVQSRIERKGNYEDAIRSAMRATCVGDHCSASSTVIDDDTLDTTVCNNTLPLHCRCKIIGGKCRARPDDPYCCWTNVTAALRNPWAGCEGLPGCLPLIPSDLRLPLLTKGDFAWMEVFADPATCDYCRSDWYSGFFGMNVDWFIGGLKMVLFLIRCVFNEPVKLYLEHFPPTATEETPAGVIQAVYDTIVNYSSNMARNLATFCFGWLMFPGGYYPSFALFCFVMNIGNLVYLCFVISIMALLVYAFSEFVMELIDFTVNVAQSRQMQKMEEEAEKN